MQVAELGAFVVHPAYRRAGFGDSLLDYVEQARGSRVCSHRGSWLVQRLRPPPAPAACNCAGSCTGTMPQRLHC